MSITLNDLYHQSKKQYKLKLIAGELGLKNVVSWTQYTEDIKTMNFLKGSELILTTGLNSNGSMWIRDFINELINQKSTGLIINVGNYIAEEDIEEEIIQLCNRNGFPLFIMPWEIRLSDIMQDFCNQLLHDSKYQDNITIALSGVIHQPELASKYYSELSSYGFLQNETYGVLAISIHNMKEQSEKLKHILLQIANILNQEKLNYHMYTEDKMLFVIMHNINQNLVESAVAQLEKFKPITRIGIGDISDSIAFISMSYYQALAALNTAQYKDINICYFGNLGIYRILYFVKEVELLEKIYLESLGVLLEYDKLRGSNLVETLEFYILYDTSIQLVAEKTFTHRNTVNYRVKKIKELLEDDLNSMESKFKFQMAFYIKNYLKIRSIQAR